VTRSLATGGLEADGYLEGVVDPPLETSEGADHDNTGTDTVPETLESDLGVDLGDLLADGGVRGFLVEDGNHGVSGVRDDGAEDTSQVARHEHNGELGALGVSILALGEDVVVEGADNVLEGTELHHGVGDLSHPQGAETLVETVPALVGLDGVEALKEARGEVRGLHSNFNLHDT
jgi:hypothetical protein